VKPMPAIDNLFKRLAELLPAGQVRRLEALYRSDKAADERASRQRTKARQAAQRLARAQRDEAEASEEKSE
jgi:hypothetical protein